MAYWSAEKGEIVTVSATPYPGYPDWLLVDCGCCNGVAWGTVPPPREHELCNGSGRIACHVPTGALAKWPGGPFVGAPAREEELRRWKEEAV